MARLQVDSACTHCALLQRGTPLLCGGLIRTTTYRGRYVSLYWG